MSSWIDVEFQLSSGLLTHRHNIYMNNSSIISEPSIGQREYLRYLQNRAKELPSYMLMEIKAEIMDIPAVEKAISFFLKRHESVRTVFPLIDGEIRQEVLPETDERFKIEHIDVVNLKKPFTDSKEEYYKEAATLFSHIDKGPLIKFYLFKVEGFYYNFSLLIHHIICDEWSYAVMSKELTWFYECYASGNEPDIQPMASQLRNYCDAQNALLCRNREELSAFWKNKLQGFDSLFDIASFYEGYSRRKNMKLSELPDKKNMTLAELTEIYDRKGAFSYTKLIAGDKFENLKKMAELNKCTFSSLIYASLYILIYAYTRRNKVLLATLVADRYIPAHQCLIGCLLGAIYLPESISDQVVINDFIRKTFLDFTTSCSKIIFDHDYLDLDGIRLRAICDMYINYKRQEYNLNKNFGSIEKHVEISEVYYPLICTAGEYDDGFAFAWNYSKYLFDKEVIEDLVKCHEDILVYMSLHGSGTIRDILNYLE